jgi:hypothetical protein
MHGIGRSTLVNVLEESREGDQLPYEVDRVPEEHVVKIFAVLANK